MEEGRTKRKREGRKGKGKIKKVRKGGGRDGRHGMG